MQSSRGELTCVGCWISYSACAVTPGRLSAAAGIFNQRRRCSDHLNSSFQSVCHRDNGGRFSVMSVALHRIRLWSADAASSSADVSAMTIRIPLLANSLAVASPMPDAAPVMTATLPGFRIWDTISPSCSQFVNRAAQSFLLLGLRFQWQVIR